MILDWNRGNDGKDPSWIEAPRPPRQDGTGTAGLPGPAQGGMPLHPAYPALAEILMRQIILHLEPVLSDTGAPEVNMFKT
jgi:hypothetical protein